MPSFGTNLNFGGHWAPTKLAVKKRVANRTEGYISREGADRQVSGWESKDEDSQKLKTSKPFYLP